MEITGCFVTFLDEVNKYVVLHKFCYNYNIVGSLAMIFLKNSTLNNLLMVSSGENMYDE